MQRLNRNEFRAHTVAEAAKMPAAHYKKLSWQQRIEIAHYLNSIAFNFPLNDPPKLDRTKFSVRGRNQNG